MSRNKQAKISPKNLPSEIREVYVFGDLLSDTGNLFNITSEAFGAGFPSAPFFEGRYSNGQLWVESLASELGIAYNFDTNFALIGATTGLDNVGNPFDPNDVVEQLGLPGTLAQVNNFIASTPNIDPNGLYTIWAGIYDFGLRVTDTTELVNNITTAVENLANAGAKNIIVPNLPNLNQFPGTSDIAGTDNLDEMIDIFNSNLLEELDELDAKLDSEVNLIQLDAYDLFDRILNNPTQFGFTNVSDRFISTSADDSGIRYEVINSDANPDEYAFFGGTVPGVPAQPSAATHRLIAQIAVSALASEGIDATEQFGTVNSDRISGNNDSDNILGLAGDDKIRGRRGADILSGGAGDDTLKGNRGEDYLLGGSGNDVLVGGKNDDILNGGSGHNYLKGGFGRDIFVVNFNGNATIQDFNPNRDRIDLAGSLAFSDLDILQNGSDTIIYFDRTEIARLSEFEADFLSIDNFIEIF